MKIIVNATPLMNITTGIGRYIKELYAAISRRYPEIEIQYFNGTGIKSEIPVSPEGKDFWEFAVKMAWRLPFFIPYLARIIIHKKRSRNFLSLSKGFDLYHEAGYFPFQASGRVKTVFTIHDLSLKVLPGFHPLDRVLFFNKYFEKSLKYTDAFITPSVFTKNEITAGFPQLDAGNIHAIHHGFDNTLFFKRSKNAVDALAIKFKLPEKYILFVGTSDPRKNIKMIIKALAYLPGTIKLVCTGWTGWDKIAENNQSEDIIKNRVIFTNYVSDQELAVLYSGARAFVYPSLYEGFGLPVLEAMACGCPVICSDSSSLTEVAGNSGFICPLTDPACLADSINKIFLSDHLYAEMSLDSLNQAKKFSWAIAAEKTINVFKDTIQY